MDIPITIVCKNFTSFSTNNFIILDIKYKPVTFR